MSSNPEEARRRVIDLYRGSRRKSLSGDIAAPEIVTLYAISTTSVYVRHCIHQKFEANQHVTDPHMIEILIHNL